ncbi:hypothetical protein [Halobiforma nitratireducens]|nr:hypothetical protein [Halobiforma nitratireducens]
MSSGPAYSPSLVSDRRRPIERRTRQYRDGQATAIAWAVRYS